MTIEIKLGEHYLWRHQEVTVKALEADRAIVEYERDGRRLMRSLKPEDLKLIPEHPDFEESPLLAIDTDAWEQACRRRDVLAKIVELDHGRSKAIAEGAKQLDITERQLWRLLAVYQQNPCSTALLSGKAGRPYDLRRLGKPVEDVIADCIEKHYLKPEKPSVRALWRAVESICAEKALKCPSYRTLRRRVERMALKEVTLRRKGSKAAAELCDGVPGVLEVGKLLERIEIDHTLVDAILRADTPAREVVGRPWLTVAIDCRSRMVLGFYLGFEPPSAASVAMCLAMAALPKDSWLAAMGISATWPAFGIPKQIWMDNALEFRSMAVRRGCKQHGIIPSFRPVGSPRYGGIIERLIGTLMGFVHLLPGTTQSSVAELGDYDAEKRATMTLSEFVPWFTEQVVTQYHLNQHGGLGIPPIRKWEQDLAISDVKAPRDALEYYASFLPAARRRLTRIGVQLATDNFWSDDFSPWVGQKKQVLVHYHRMDARQVYVRLPDGRIAVAENSDKSALGKTFSDLKQKREHNRVISADPVLTNQRIEGFRRNQARLEEATKNTSRATRKKPVLPIPPAPVTALPVLAAAKSPSRSAVALEVVELVTTKDLRTKPGRAAQKTQTGCAAPPVSLRTQPSIAAHPQVQVT